jgi:cystathionine beta-lyase
MDFEIAAPIRSLLIQMIEDSDTGYLGAIPELGESFEWFANHRWGWSVDKEEIFTATDVGVGMVEMARQFVKPGDRILLNTPVYHNFSNWISELGCEKVEAPLKQNGMHFTLDMESIEEEYKKGVVLHFLCNPHNPVGTVFSKEELITLAQLAKKYGVVIFSDEIHAPLTFDETQFHPFLSVSDTAREVGIIVTSASKTWNLAGLKCAFIITANAQMKDKAITMPNAVHYRASLLGAVASAEAFRCIDWLDSALTRIDANRHLMSELLSEHAPLAQYRIPDFGYLAWVDLGAYDLGENPSQLLLEKAKVSTNPGHTFGKQCPSFVRINFGTSPEILSNAMAAIGSVLK